MRTPITPAPSGKLQVRAVAGTYVVLLAFDCDKTYAKGLLGFGIQRKDHSNDETVWLRGLKSFDLPNSTEGEDASTRQNPVQKFHWGDYTTKAGRKYTYTIHALEGTPGSLTVREKVTVSVICETPEKLSSGGHQVFFNRSAAASQAYSRRFGNVDPKKMPEEQRKHAYAWLSRGLEEALLGYIQAAQRGQTLHLFVYEFEKAAYLAELVKARKRGVKLQIVVDDLPAGPREENRHAMKEAGITLAALKANGKWGAGDARPRTGNVNISHNKFMILSEKGKPLSVWTGSTNWTDSGVYSQTNVGHVITDTKAMQTYFDWHQAIWQAPDTDKKGSRVITQQLTQLPPGNQAAGTVPVFSPRNDTAAITACALRVAKGRKLVCFTAPFAMHDELEAALLANAPVQVLGLLNKDGVVDAKLHQAPNTKLAAATALKTSELEQRQLQWHEESMYHSGVFIHTKIILVDPLSDAPVIITGSANFSNNSSVNNDENQLFIVGEKAVADIYLGEFLRMFDHYYFRSHKKKVAASSSPAKERKKAFLCPDDGWTGEYFGNGPKQASREAFF